MLFWVLLINETLLNLIDSNKHKFEIILLTANKNYKQLFKQANKFKVKNLIINNHKSYQLLNNELKILE